MTVKIFPGKIFGEIQAIPSKSHLHRLLIYAALADKETFISCAETNAEDIVATISCLSALGARIVKKEDGFFVTPIDRDSLPRGVVTLPCCESGSTLRFLLPVVAALGVHGAFEMKGRLAERPLAPLDEQLQKHGVKLWRDDDGLLHCEGQLSSGDFVLPGDVSSQYVTGLLMALPLLGDGSVLTVSTPVESADYIEITKKTAREFGVKSVTINSPESVRYTISPCEFKSPERVTAEGDWSNSAFWLCAGAMPGGDMTVSGLEKNSTQGDREIVNILEKMGARVTWEAKSVNIKEGTRTLPEIDGAAIPDLIPVLAAVAAVSEGTTIFKNAARLRIKESDRLKTTADTLSKLGADIKETPDGLIVNGKKTLIGGEVNGHGDHRIPMMAAVASTACQNPVTVTGAQAVNKSYPAFWEDLRLLGKKTETEE
ncbi:MAG: 3-phosphoshikimate 1-carboxyvinyltransferase [Defluviitaleaceae bacterium]|nr:3-phosphoshikimate 1-carboxyvinyltransferase [Defluviitaleaceae bacterium]